MANVNVALALFGLCAVFGATNAANEHFLNSENLGLLIGMQVTSEAGSPYYAFRGIPYAEPPVGDLRFKEPKEAAPVPKATFRNATVLGPSCLQMYRNPARLVGNEDCLHLNVYTPSYLCNDNTTLPVLVFFHGGAFVYGAGGADPNRVVSRGIVVVTANYRLGILGFLSSGDKNLPGNLGLLDQQLVLKWIQKNIRGFCGDPKRVTLSGPSAGGAATTLHMVSPDSRGLFQQAIATSGVFLNPWVQHFGNAEKVRSVARAAGCTAAANAAVSSLLPCLRSVNASKLVEAQLQFQGWHETPFSPFGPVIDGTFISKDPYKLLKEGKFAMVPLLLSHTTEEGLYVVAEFMSNKTALSELDQNWSEIAPLLLDYEETARTKEDRDNTSKKIRSKYLGNMTINTNTVPLLIQLEGDRHFVAGIDHFARTLAAARGSKPVYMYQYGYKAEYSVSQSWNHLNSSENRGSAHVDDLNLVFPGSSARPARTMADKNMTKSMVDIWESFIKRGVPVTENFPVWKPVPTAGDSITIMRITGYNNGTLINVPELGNGSWWRSLPLKESGFSRGVSSAAHAPSIAVLLIITSAIFRLATAK